jgi:hypothetical protein
MQLIACAIAIAILTTTGCSIRATTDQILDTTSNVTGTTSSARSWFRDDGLVKPDFKTTAFVSFNHANLSQDLAAGRGEYLAAASALLGVSAERQPAFFSAAQAHYAGMTTASAPTLLTLLQDTASPFVQATQASLGTDKP